MPNGKKVAVIGAGPAGIGCAAALAAMGYAVDVFEKEDRAAGVVSGEIPRFRISDEEIEADLRELDPSIKFHFGREISSAELEGMAGEYDAVFVGAGLRFDRFTGVDIAEGASGVYGCAAFLKKLKSGELGSLSGTVFVIGGGNSALDSAASALLHGASKAVIAYRRSRNEMPSCSEEFLDTADRGVELMYMVSPVAVRPKGDGLEITFRRNELVDAPGEARKSFRGIPGSEFTAEASCMVFAVGKSGDEGLVSGTADESTCRIGDTNCFAGGDFTHGGGTIVEAVADGKKAAAAIDAFLS